MTFLFVLNVTLQKCNPTFHSLRLTLCADARSLPGCENRMLWRCYAAYWKWRQIIWSDIICLRFSWHVASDSVHALSSVYSYTTASSHHLIQRIQTPNANTGWKAPAIPKPSEDRNDSELQILLPSVSPCSWMICIVQLIKVISGSRGWG